jgi:hypothetical protein
MRAFTESHSAFSVRLTGARYVVEITHESYCQKAERKTPRGVVVPARSTRAGASRPRQIGDHNARKRKEPMKVLIEYELKPSIVQGLLVDCFEGGYSPWIHKVERVKGDYDPSANLVWWGQDGLVKDQDGCLKSFTIKLVYDREEDAEGDGTGETTLFPRKIADGLATLSKAAPACFTRIITEEGDALDADAFMQCCVFGKIVYG